MAKVGMAKVPRRGTGKTAYSTRRARQPDANISAAKPAAGKAGPATGRGKNYRAAAKGAEQALKIATLTKRLAQARLHIARLEARADTDFLLDIPNRRGFERELNRSIAYVKRYRASAALLVVDVDRLKPINDGFGHAAGDHVLKTIVGILSANIRQSDMLGRLGGDEFGILLWNLGEADALAKALALEQAVDGAACEYRGRRISLGVSTGVGVLGADDEAAKVFELADRAMYARKLSRRGIRKPAIRR